MFSKQTNVTNGPQQVNSGTAAPTAASHATENQIQPNRLLEASYGERLDSGAQGKTSCENSHLEALESGHGPAHDGGITINDSGTYRYAWNQATGPRTTAGKAKAARNAFTGSAGAKLRQLSWELNALLKLCKIK